MNPTDSLPLSAVKRLEAAGLTDYGARVDDNGKWNQTLWACAIQYIAFWESGGRDGHCVDSFDSVVKGVGLQVCNYPCICCLTTVRGRCELNKRC